MEKYTVVIPTRDRAETLAATLRTCIRQTYENFEIVVSDNCSNDNTKEIVGQFHDPRIQYINPGRRLSMSGNFEFALGHVADGFVMFIGSDDGVMPDAIEYVNSIVETHSVDAVACRQATYVWPEFPDREIAGRLVFGGLREDVEVRNSKAWIKKTLSFEAPYCFDLPNLYCGFVHKRIINKAYKNGKYFRSITPDAYSAFATAIFVDEYAFSHRPFSIAGASAKSNGASGLHSVGDGKETARFDAENDIELCDGFVNCPSYEVIAAEAFSQLSKAFPELCASYRIDYTRMLNDSLANANSRTEAAVKSAVAIMARNFSVKLDGSLQRMSKLRRVRLNDVIRALRVLLGRSKIVAVERSFDIGVENVDDAALVAHALRQKITGRNSLVTSRDLLKQYLKQLTGFRSRL